MNKVYLLIGGNLGIVKDNLLLATQQISSKIGQVIQVSAIYQTKAWGMENQPDFLNQVLLVETTLTADKVLENTQIIENNMGRVRLMKNGPRIIDIDILFYNDDIIHSSQLSVPHPLLQQRNFVLHPMSDIAPDLIHPVLHKSILQLKQQSPDKLEVLKID